MTVVTKKFKAGDFVFREGDVSDCLYVIKNGRLSIRRYKNPGYVEIARLNQNEVVGELAFFDRKPRSASIVAITDVELLRIDFKSLEKSFASTPKYIKTIIMAVAQRLRKANDLIRQLQNNTVGDDLAETDPKINHEVSDEPKKSDEKSDSEE